MRRLWFLNSFFIVVLGLVMLGENKSYAADIEDDNAIYSAPLVKTVLSDGSIENVEFSYSGTDDKGIVWFSGTIPGTYVKLTVVESVGNERALVPLLFHLGYQVVNRNVHMIARADSPPGTNAQYYRLIGSHYSSLPSLRSYDSRTNGTGSITCGGRDMGTHRAGNHFIDTEGTAYGFNLLGTGKFYASTNITVR
ncbi:MULTISPECIES: hypothetical protein [unclassified Enterococcus]|uniref:hypothetical protein n=1 Tax=unclassified Enterococcus TaxID=2608891 RepID=UPI001A912127|nr:MULTISPECIES: hypothetical protein [unclassified Enterococcus]MBO0462533.1 hypothetical protein [Enterococcus sp. DIV1298c]MBO1301144.1 hypothetical protein [Enterococcus sp. DIV1271a]